MQVETVVTHYTCILNQNTSSSFLPSSTENFAQILMYFNVQTRGKHYYSPGKKSLKFRMHHLICVSNVPYVPPLKSSHYSKPLFKYHFLEAVYS